MALQIHSVTSFTNKPYHHIPHSKPKISIKSQNPSETPKPTTNLDETTSEATPTKKTSSSGLGFGSSSSSPSNVSTTVTSNKKQKSKRERASIIRRSPVEKPAAFVSKEDKVKGKETSRNESAFLLTWLGLGGLILVEGLVLASSGMNSCFFFFFCYRIENCFDADVECMKFCSGGSVL